MKKILLLIIILLIPINVYAAEVPELYSQKYLVYDLTEDEVLVSKRSDEVSKIASITKIMTAIVAIENVNNLKEEIIITQEMLNGIPWDAAVLGLQVGHKVTVEDMLYAALLPSAADATHILAHYVAGGTKEYVRLMNDKAVMLGLTHTKYENVIGMDHESHYSTADDVVKLLKYCLKNPEFKKIFTDKHHILLNGMTANSTIHIMQNVIMRDTSRILGGKTGYTDDAGVCIAAYFKSNGHEMLVITLKAPYEKWKANHITDALDLINFVDNNFGNQIIIEKGTPIATIDVKLSDIKKINVTASNNITKFLSNDYNKDLVSYEYEGATEILYNFKKGDELGKISYYYDGKLVGNEFVTLNETLSPDLKEIFDLYKTQLIVIGCATIFGIITVIVLLKKSLV